LNAGDRSQSSVPPQVLLLENIIVNVVRLEKVLIGKMVDLTIKVYLGIIVTVSSEEKSNDTQITLEIRMTKGIVQVGPTASF
jgi:hypothetical protein